MIELGEDGTYMEDEEDVLSVLFCDCGDNW